MRGGQSFLRQEDFGGRGFLAEMDWLGIREYGEVNAIKLKLLCCCTLRETIAVEKKQVRYPMDTERKRYYNQLF